VFGDCGLAVVAAESREDCLYFLLEARGEPRLAPAEYPMDPLLPLAAVRFQNSLDYVREQVGGALARGERVALHGANNGLNNLLVLAGLASANENLLIFDGDEAKTGKYLPASPTPIRHSSDAEYRKVDRAFIAALTFYPEIQRFLTGAVGLKPERIQPVFPLAKLAD
jgi:hypothetical protein